MWKTEHSESTTATPETVWALVSDVAGWPSWNPGYREAGLDGGPAPGTPGHVTLPNGMRRPFTVAEATRSTAFVIAANGPGLRQRFFHRLERTNDGGARVTMGATMEGLLTPLFSRMFGKVIAGYTPTAVRQLVAKAEASTSAAPTKLERSRP
jgi:Polyketide cyclase / dehydrase and lipid transport